MHNALKTLRVTDWVLAGGVALWGLFKLDPWWLAVGAVSLLLAYINPGARIKGWLERKLLGRAGRPESSEIAVREAMADLAHSETNFVEGTSPANNAVPNYAVIGFSAYGAVVLSTNPHNRLSTEGLQLEGKPILWA